MKPKLDGASQSAQGQLFDAGPALVDFIDMENSMVRLADSIQWEVFEEHWQSLYSAAGGPMASACRKTHCRIADAQAHANHCRTSVSWRYG